MNEEEEEIDGRQRKWNIHLLGSEDIYFRIQLKVAAGKHTLSSGSGKFSVENEG